MVSTRNPFRNLLHRWKFAHLVIDQDDKAVPGFNGIREGHDQVDERGARNPNDMEREQSDKESENDDFDHDFDDEDDDDIEDFDNLDDADDGMDVDA